MCWAKYAHRRTKWIDSGDLWLRIRAATLFPAPGGDFQLHLHTAQQLLITEATLQQDEHILRWEGTEQREQHPKLLSDTEVKVTGIHMQPSSSHQQDTWLAPLSYLPNSLAPLQGEQAMAAFLFSL